MLRNEAHRERPIAIRFFKAKNPSFSNNPQTRFNPTSSSFPRNEDGELIVSVRGDLPAPTRNMEIVFTNTFGPRLAPDPVISGDITPRPVG